MQQGDLFDLETARKQRQRRKGMLADTPRARETDPGTSHSAADFVKQTGIAGDQQRQVLNWVRLWPGHTSSELAREVAQAHGGHWTEYRWLIARRLPELRPQWVRNGEARPCGVSGRPALTWYPVESGPIAKAA